MNLSIQSRNAALNALSALCDGGSISFFTGAIPDSPENATRGNLLSSGSRFGSKAFAPAENGMITSNPIEPDISIRRNGEAGWARIFAKDGTPIFDCTIGTKDADIILTNTRLEQGAILQINSFNYSLPQ